MNLLIVCKEARQHERQFPGCCCLHGESLIVAFCDDCSEKLWERREDLPSHLGAVENTRVLAFRSCSLNSKDLSCELCDVSSKTETWHFEVTVELFETCISFW